MSMTNDLREDVINRLTLETLQLLKEAGKDKPATNGGYYAWFQGVIARAEAENNAARSLAAVVVMKAYGEELTSPDQTFYLDRLQSRINLGIRRRLAPLMDNDRRQIELLYSLLFTLPGSPVLYYGDELGMGDNIYLGDRNGVRTPMQWTGDRNAGFSRADPSQLYQAVLLDPVYHYNAINVVGNVTVDAPVTETGVASDSFTLVQSDTTDTTVIQTGNLYAGSDTATTVATTTSTVQETGTNTDGRGQNCGPERSAGYRSYASLRSGTAWRGTCTPETARLPESAPRRRSPTPECPGAVRSIP